MVSIDSSVIVQIINFLFLIAALNFILYRPIRKILAQRKEKVSGLEASIEDLSQDARQKDEAFSEGVKAAKTKGLQEKETIVQSATDEERKLVEEINKRSQANLMEIQEKITKEAAEVKASLQKEIDSFAEDIGQKILGRAF
jgi:F-type H+-transporting ATPase subunit b